MVPTPLADPAFVSLLEQFSMERLQAEANPIFGLWPNLRVAYANPAGERLVREGAPALGTWGVGSSILPALPERLRFFYVEEMQRVLASGKIFRHDEPLLSPAAHGRRVQILPLWGSGLLLSSVPVIEGAPAALDAVYRSDNGFLLECSYCHTFRRAGPGERWDWVPPLRGAHPRSHHPRRLLPLLRLPRALSAIARDPGSIAAQSLHRAATPAGRGRRGPRFSTAAPVARPVQNPRASQRAGGTPHAQRNHRQSGTHGQARAARRGPSLPA